MKETKLYYTAPSDEIFNEVKLAALKIWFQYDDTYGYASEKTQRIEPMKNIEDNLMYMVAMFDFPNQQKLAQVISPEARKEIRDRMIDGGQPEMFNPF